MVLETIKTKYNLGLALKSRLNIFACLSPCGSPHQVLPIRNIASISSGIWGQSMDLLHPNHMCSFERFLPLDLGSFPRALLEGLGVRGVS